MVNFVSGTAPPKFFVNVEVKLMKADGEQVAHTDREYTIKDLSKLPMIFENAKNTFSLLVEGIKIETGYDEAV